MLKTPQAVGLAAVLSSSVLPAVAEDASLPVPPLPISHAVTGRPLNVVSPRASEKGTPPLHLSDAELPRHIEKGATRLAVKSLAEDPPPLTVSVGAIALIGLSSALMGCLNPVGKVRRALDSKRGELSAESYRSMADTLTRAESRGFVKRWEMCVKVVNELVRNDRAMAFNSDIDTFRNATRYGVCGLATVAGMAAGLALNLSTALSPVGGELLVGGFGLVALVAGFLAANKIE